MMMQEIFRSMVDHAHVKNIYGDPIVAGDKTIVPVARISYGFGGGTRGKEEGGGGGGGLKAYPAGFIEITPAATRFVAIGEKRKIAGALILGIGLGMLAGRRHFGIQKGVLNFLRNR